MDAEDANTAKDGSPGLLRAETAEWTGKNKNPDYNTVVVHGSNEGYVSKMLVSEKGSYLTYGFTQAVMRNIERKQRIATGISTILGVPQDAVEIERSQDLSAGGFGFVIEVDVNVDQWMITLIINS